MGMWNYGGVRVPLSEEQVKGYLKRHDTNGDGKLSQEELKLAFCNLRMRHCGWRSRRAMKHADQNQDGFISDEEMQELVKYSNSKWGYFLS